MLCSLVREHARPPAWRSQRKPGVALGLFLLGEGGYVFSVLHNGELKTSPNKGSVSLEAPASPKV